MPPMKHSVLGASSSHRWMHCAGSVRMSKGLPNVETPYQLEGRAAHVYAESVLHGSLGLIAVTIDSEKGRVQWPVDPAMHEAVMLFVETVQSTHQKLGGQLYIERTFDLGALRPPLAMFGTADAVVVAERTLVVFDLKYGVGVVVEVLDNTQLLYYALGAILAEATRRWLEPNFVVGPEEMLLDVALRLFDTVRIIIVQPRAAHTDGPVRESIELSSQDIREFADRLMIAARATQAPDAPLTAGRWCQFCPARGHCPELAAHAKLVAQTDFESVPMEAPPDVAHLPIERVAEMMKGVAILEMFVRAMVERITRELESGREVPGWKLVSKRPRRVWADPVEVEKWCHAAGIDSADLWTHEFASPAQIEKIVGKTNLPDALYARVSSGLTLVSDSDPRPAAAVGPAEDFAQLPPAQQEND